jgi:CysZ protein
MQFISNAVHGFKLAFRGATFLRQHRTLWTWAVLPAGVNVIVFAAAFALFLQFYPDIYDHATGFLRLDSPEVWYAWLWVAPLRLLAWCIGILLISAAMVVIYLTFLLLGTAIASPFLDILAQRVEHIAAGHVPTERLTLRTAFRSFTASALIELQKLGVFLTVQFILFALSLIPLLSPFTVIAATLFTMLFLSLEYGGFAMDHRQMRFAQRRRLLWQHRWRMLGFGAAGFVTLLVPLLNFVCLPILVVGGTLLIVELPDGKLRGQ